MEQHQTHTAPVGEPSKTSATTSTDHRGHGAATTDAEAHESNSLMVMAGNDMGIPVGGNPRNVMSMGQMGSGTSWQPSSTQMNMIQKSAGDWLLMFHYNAFVGVNSSGGRRGTTKFESANWFMPMAF